MEKKSRNLLLKIPIFKIGIRILIFLAFVTGTALALRPLHIMLLDNMANFRDSIIAEAESLIGRRIQYASMGPSIFGVLDVRDIVILREDDSVMLSISRLRFSYSFWELIRGNLPNSIQSARVDRPILSLDFEKDWDLLELISGLTRESSTSSEIRITHLFPEDFSLRIFNGELDLSGTDLNFKLESFSFEANIRQEQLSFNSNWDVFLELNPADFLPSFNISMGASLSGIFYDGTNEGSASFSIPYLNADTFRLMPLNMVFIYSEEKIEVRKIQDTYPFTVWFVYDFINDHLSGRFIGENFIFSDVLRFSGSWENLNPLLDIRITGDSGFEYRAGELEYNINFSSTGTPDNFSSSVTLDIHAHGDSEGLLFDLLEIDSPYGGIAFSGGIDFIPDDHQGDYLNLIPFIPYGSLAVRDFRFYGTEGINGNFLFNTQGREVNLIGSISAGELIYPSFHFHLFQENNTLGFNVSAGSTDESRISAEGFLDYDYSQHLQVNVRLDNLYMGDILKFMEALIPLEYIPSPLYSMLSNVSVNTEVFFDSDFERLLFNVPSFRASYMDILALNASISGTNNRLVLEQGIISFYEEDILFSGSTEFYEDSNDVYFTLLAFFNDLSYQFNGIFADRKELIITGSYDFFAYLLMGENGSINGFVYGEALPVLSGRQMASLNFYLSLDYYSPYDWELDIERIEILRLSTPSSNQASLSLRGAANERGMHIPYFVFTDSLGPLEGSIAFNWNYTFTYMDFLLDFNSAGHSEHYLARGLYDNNVLELSLNGTGMQLRRISTLNAVLSGNFSLFWESIDNFNADLFISSFVINQGSQLIQASGNVQVNNDLAHVEELNIFTFGVDTYIPSILIDRRQGLLSSSAFVSGNLSGIDINIDMYGSAEFISEDNWYDLYRDLKSLEASLLFQNAQYGDMIAEEAFSFDFSFQNLNDGIAMRVNGGPRNMLRLSYDPLNGNGQNGNGQGAGFSVSLSAPFPVRGSVTGTVIDNFIDAYWANAYVDMEALWRFIPDDLTPFLQIPDGIITGSLRIGGTLSEPEFFGALRASGAHITLPLLMSVPIRPVPVIFLFEGNEITFGPVNAVAGSGVGVAEGWFRFEHWIPETLSISISVPSSSPIPADIHLGGIIVNGYAYGTALLEIEDYVLTTTGEIYAVNTEISMNYDESFNIVIVELPVGRLSTLTDVTIRADRRVDFFWPSIDFPILQANAGLGSGIRLIYDGYSSAFSLTGDVNLRSGELFYLERNFYIREGTLFFREDESSFDPIIYARAEMRDQTQDGPVIISLIIDYMPLFSFSPRFESNPPLPQTEIYALLGQIPPEGMDGSGRNIAAGMVLDTLTQFYFMNRVQRELRNFLGLDMLSIRTQFLQNVVLQATGGMTQTSHPDPNTGSSTNTFTFGNYFDNTTVFIGKYLSQDVFGQAMLTLRYEDQYLGGGGIRLEPEIGLELRNPLFDIRLSLIPMNPRSWFIEDVSFSLIWRRSF